MTEIRSLSAPALGQHEINRLLAMTAPKRMTSDSTLFDTGYEQAKRDFRELLLAALRIPHDEVQQVREPGMPILVRETRTAERVSFFARWRNR
jgi:hypothetical protein